MGQMCPILMEVWLNFSIYPTDYLQGHCRVTENKIFLQSGLGYFIPETSIVVSRWGGEDTLHYLHEVRAQAT